MSWSPRTAALEEADLISARIQADLFARQLCDTPTLESIAALLRCHYSDPQAIHADMPIETNFGRNQFLALLAAPLCVNKDSVKSSEHRSMFLYSWEIVLPICGFD